MIDALAQVDWARLAAFIDGEGSICIVKSKRHTPTGYTHVLAVQVSNTDSRMTLWCYERFGGNHHVCRSKGDRKHKALCTWKVFGKCAAFILQECLPYFVIKREQAEIALVFRETFDGASITKLKRDNCTIVERTPDGRMSKVKVSGPSIVVDPGVLELRETLRLQLAKEKHAHSEFLQ